MSKYDEVLEEARDNIMKAYDPCHVLREMCREDRLFGSVTGYQWASPGYGPLDTQDSGEEKPEFEFNKIELRITKLKEQYRQNTIEAKFVPSNPSADQSVDTVAGLYRADQHDSKAQLAYLNAFEEAATGGMGAWRVCTSYENLESEEDDYQRVRFEPIYEADGRVYFDPNSKCQDKSDANYCFVITGMPTKDFEKKYGKQSSPWSSFSTERNSVGMFFNWASQDTVYVIEYYVKETKKQRLVFFEGLSGEKEKHYESDLQENPNLEEDLIARGFERVGVKTSKRCRVHKYTIGADSILEDDGYIPCNLLPIIPVYGKYMIVNGVEYFSGEVRSAKDAQRLSNSLRSKLAEISMMSSAEVPIVLREQIAGCEDDWANKERDRLAFVTLNGIENPDGSLNPMGPVGYTKPPAIPPALAALLEFTNRDMQEILGIEENQINLSNVSNETFMGAQERVDSRAYVYLSNLALAMEQSARVWLSFAKNVYVDQGRKVKLMSKEGDRYKEELMTNGYYGENGETIFENDLSKSEFDVDIEIGPTSQSKRKMIVKTMLEMLSVTSDESYRSVLTAVALMNMEGEGLSDVRKYFRKDLVGKGVIPPTKQEAQEMQEAAENQPPDPTQVLMQAMAEKEQAQAQLSIVDAQKKQADAAKIEAETIKTYSEIDRQDAVAAFNMMQSVEQATAENNQPTPTNQP